MKLRLITAISLIVLCLCLLAGCGEEETPTTTATPVTTMSWEEKDAIDKANIATNNTALGVALADLGVSEDAVVVHTITPDENRMVEMFLELDGVMYHYVVDTERCVVMSKIQEP